MVPRHQVQAVCDGIRSSFPDTEADVPMVPNGYFEAVPDVVVIRNEHHALRIAEECFDYGPPAIVRALTAMDYALLLSAYRRLFLASSFGEASTTAHVVAAHGNWYLATWPVPAPPHR